MIIKNIRHHCPYAAIPTEGLACCPAERAPWRCWGLVRGLLSLLPHAIASPAFNTLVNHCKGMQLDLMEEGRTSVLAVPGVPPLVTIASRCGMSLRRSSLSFGVPLSRLCLLLQIQGLASMQACAPACVGSELQMTRKWSIYKGPSKIQNLH